MVKCDCWSDGYVGYSGHTLGSELSRRTLSLFLRILAPDQLQVAVNVKVPMVGLLSSSTLLDSRSGLFAHAIPGKSETSGWRRTGDRQARPVKRHGCNCALHDNMLHLFYLVGLKSLV